MRGRADRPGRRADPAPARLSAPAAARARGGRARDRLVAGLSDLLRRSRRRRHRPRDGAGGGCLARLRCDPNQLESAILNLAINARDAMPGGGKLAIEDRQCGAGRRAVPVPRKGLPPGDYVLIAVTDTGVGMTPEVAAKAFEPFFTTKKPGAGYRARPQPGLWLRAAIRRPRAAGERTGCWNSGASVSSPQRRDAGRTRRYRFCRKNTATRCNRAFGHGSSCRG